MKNLRRTIRVLVVVGSAGLGAQSGWAEEPGRAWDGLNPFAAAAATTDCYGSGDAKLDGVIDSLDVELVNRMIAGEAPPNARADVDGNGVVDRDDVGLIAGAVSGAGLPGWWGRLETRAARELWLRRMLELDPTDQHPYTPSWLQCVGFSTQLFLRFASYHADTFGTDFGASQSAFNLPVYCVSVLSSNFSHAINAILVGDDPLRFSDWYFIEPQDDRQVLPGQWDMPYDSRLTIYVPRDIQAVGQSRLSRITFNVSRSGGLSDSRDPGLVLVRESYLPSTMKPEANVWSPLLLPSGEGALLAERTRDDLSRIGDLHGLADMLDPDGAWTALTGDEHFSRPLDATAAAEGGYHLLWKGEPEAQRSVLWGRLDLAGSRLLRQEVIASNRAVLTGRVAEDAARNPQVVWLEAKLHISHPFESGLYWSQRGSSGWRSPERIVGVTNDLDPWHWEGIPDARKYFFDVASRGAGKLVLVWAQRETLFSKVQLSEMRYDGSWGSGRLLQELEGACAGVDLESDPQGRVHLAYWSGPTQQGRNEGRGRLEYRVLEGDNWSAPEVVDVESGALCPALVVQSSGAVGVVWDKLVDGRSAVVWSERRGPAWTPPLVLPATPDVALRYPRAAEVEPGHLAVIWSELTPDVSRVGWVFLTPGSASEPARTEPRLRLSSASPPVLQFSTVPGHPYRLEARDDLFEGAWSSVETHEAAEGYAARVTDRNASPAGQRYYRVVWPQSPPAATD